LADNGELQQLLKVGYVSATGFQGNTTTARFMQRIFSLHDASRVEVICIARAGDDGTSERSFIKESCKEWLQFEKNDLYVQPRQKPPQRIITAVADTVRLPPLTPSACMFSST
jgi:predicted O-linked N-acetylglucosamine transferase (SPINDLY family)